VGKLFCNVLFAGQGVRLHFYDTQLSDFPWYYLNAGQVFGDTFLYYRQWWFVGISVYMLLVVLCKALLDKKSIRFSVTCIPMAVFAVFSFLSAVASEYRSFCFSGSFEQFENVWVLMGYALMVYYVFLIVESEQEVQYILYVLTASTLGLGLIGTGQTFGFNFLETGIARAFITRPDVVFADEPTGNLDSRTTKEVMEMIRMFARKFHQTIVLVSHDPEMTEYADRIVTLLDGEIVSDAHTGNKDR